MFNHQDFFHALEENNLSLVQEFLNRGLNPNLEYKGRRPLTISLYNNNLEMVKVLLDDGANPNFEDSNGNRPLLIPLASGNLEILKTLLNHDADPNLPNNGSSLLSIAIEKNSYPAVKELLEHGANPNQEENGKTPLEIASRSTGSKKMVDLLLKYGARANLPLNRIYHLPYYPVERYPLTGRAIPSMTFLTTGHCTNENYLPIIRYQSLYYSAEPSEKEYCGTFYFFEPDSDIFLALGRVLIAINKFRAYLDLLTYIPEGERISFSAYWAFEQLTQRLKGNLEENPYYEDGLYYGYEYMGFFDELDQLICRAGRKADYDTILLQAEPGETRPVTEILDLRPREESFRDVCQADTPLFHQKVEGSKYPTLWFRSYGFLTF